MKSAAEFFYQTFQRNRTELSLYRLRHSSCAFCNTIYAKLLARIESAASSATERLLAFVKSSAI